MSEIKVNTITKRTGSTLTIGESGTTVALASGASQSGFKEIEWQSVVVADGSTGLTAVAGRGYFINTTGGAITVTLPSSPSAGDAIAIKDYARQFDTNNVSLDRNGSNLDGVASNFTISTVGFSGLFIYMDSTKGWSLINESNTNSIGATYTSATGGTITNSGNYRIHTFNSSSNFVVSSVGNASGSGDKVSYLVIAGGGGGGKNDAGGGGAGGFREGRDAPYNSYTASPLDAGSGLTVTAQTYPITVGAGGAGGSSPSASGSNGNPSVFSTITSTAGGGGASETGPNNGNTGGSGGGGGAGGATAGNGAAGNQPPVSPPQGNNGGNGGVGSPSSNARSGGGGGGAGGNANAGSGNGGSTVGGPGGNGAASSITQSSVTYAGGGGGGARDTGGNAGPGGGGAGGHTNSAATAGTANKGGGGGGQGEGPTSTQAGGSGVVIITYKYQN